MARDPQEVADALTERYRTEGEEHDKAAVDVREDVQAEPETEEEYNARIDAVRSTGVFGTTPTDSSTGDVVVPTADEGKASQALAEAEASGDVGNEEGQVSEAEAKRQVDASAGTTGFADEVQAGAEAQGNDDDDDDDDEDDNRIV